MFKLEATIEGNIVSQGKRGVRIPPQQAKFLDVLLSHYPDAAPLEELEDAAGGTGQAVWNLAYRLRNVVGLFGYTISRFRPTGYKLEEAGE